MADAQKVLRLRDDKQYKLWQLAEDVARNRGHTDEYYALRRAWAEYYNPKVGRIKGRTLDGKPYDQAHTHRREGQ